MNWLIVVCESRGAEVPISLPLTAMPDDAGSQMEQDLAADKHKSQSQGSLDDGGVIIQETEAYKVGHLLVH